MLVFLIVILLLAMLIPQFRAGMLACLVLVLFLIVASFIFLKIEDFSGNLIQKAIEANPANHQTEETR